MRVKKNIKKPGYLLTVILVIAICVVLALLLTVNWLSLNRLTKDNEYLEAQTEEYKEKAEKIQADWDAEKLAAQTDSSFDYLAIGNSITKHPVYGDYWWGEWGMAASAAETDYFHRVAFHISQLYAENTTEALNFTVWEDPFYDRDKTLPYLKGYLNENLDLVTVQLGENIHKSEDQSDEEYAMQLEMDWRSLLVYIRDQAPKANVMVIGQFWADDVQDTVKQSLCQELAMTYIPLNSIQGDEYRAGVGAVVMGADQNSHTIEADGVGQHPNDEAHAFISQRILENIPGMVLE